MERINGVTIFLACFLIACISQVQSQVIDITTLGAKPGGYDIAQPLLKAWEQACKSPTPTKILIPKGIYALKEISLRGPCKAHVELQVEGTIQAPQDPNAITKDLEWINIHDLNGFTLSGHGIFDGQGKVAWTKNECTKTALCSKLANNIALFFVNNTMIKEITSKDSKLFHFNVFGCQNLTFNHVTITAPGDSPNTDGIHIGHAIDIKITNVDIGTGDDCISIGDGSKEIKIASVKCGPGHGISVGSLGRYDNELPVEGVYVKDSTLTNTLNGVRIKSWPAKTAGRASDLHFDNINMQNVGNPIIIDQEYCPNFQCKMTYPSKVKLSKVSFKNIKGTISTPLAVNLVCSSSFPCDNVEIGDINLKYTGPGGPITTNCTNVNPKFSGVQIPPICKH